MWTNLSALIYQLGPIFSGDLQSHGMVSQWYLGWTQKNLRSLSHQMHQAPEDVRPIAIAPGFNSDGPQTYLEAIHITVKELIPGVIVVAVWGHEWPGRSVSIKCYRSAIRHLQTAHSLPEPHISKLEGFIRFQQAKKQPTQLLCKKWEQCGQKSRQHHAMGCSMHLLHWLHAFRGDNHAIRVSIWPGTHPTYSDISIDDPGHPTLMKLRLKASKTDPFRKG